MERVEWRRNRERILSLYFDKQDTADPGLPLRSMIPVCFKPMQVELLQPPASALLPTAASRSPSCAGAGIASLPVCSQLRLPGAQAAWHLLLNPPSTTEQFSVGFRQHRCGCQGRGRSKRRHGAGFAGTAPVSLRSGLLECVIPRGFAFYIQIGKSLFGRTSFVKSAKVKNVIPKNRLNIEKLSTMINSCPALNVKLVIILL